MTDVISGSNQFPFTTADLKYWVVKRKDGIISKYNLIGAGQVTGPTDPVVVPRLPASTTPHGWYMRDVCHHTPKGGGDTFILEENGIRLHVADSPGLKHSALGFDYILDCGDVLRGADECVTTLTGDPDLCAALLPFTKRVEPRLVKVDWYDRKAPPLSPEFFVEYAKLIEGEVVVACQGGHGRSGSSAVMLMMCLIPDYTPYAAICHLRALHCPRAIESKEQHEYIGKFGEYLGRENDVALIEGVKSYKDAFLALTNPGAKKYQDWLASGVKTAAKHVEPEEWA